jgi:hypothetical protein
VLRDFVEQLVASEELRTLDRPVSLLDLRMKVERTREMSVESPNDGIALRGRNGNVSRKLATVVVHIHTCLGLVAMRVLATG